MYKSKLKTKNVEKGVSIYLVILISTFILAVALGLSTILISKIKVSREIGYSVVALYAADTGIEEVLMNRESPNPTSGYLDLNNSGGQDTSDPTYNVNVLTPGPNCNAPNYCLRSIGTYQSVKRAIEISY